MSRRRLRRRSWRRRDHWPAVSWCRETWRARLRRRRRRRERRLRPLCGGCRRSRQRRRRWRQRSRRRPGRGLRRHSGEPQDGRHGDGRPLHGPPVRTFRPPTVRRPGRRRPYCRRWPPARLRLAPRMHRRRLLPAARRAVARRRAGPEGRWTKRTWPRCAHPRASPCRGASPTDSGFRAGAGVEVVAASAARRAVSCRSSSLPNPGSPPAADAPLAAVDAGGSTAAGGALDTTGRAAVRIERLRSGQADG